MEAVYPIVLQVVCSMRHWSVAEARPGQCLCLPSALPVCSTSCLSRHWPGFVPCYSVFNRPTPSRRSDFPMVFPTQRHQPRCTTLDRLVYFLHRFAAYLAVRVLLYVFGFYPAPLPTGLKAMIFCSSCPRGSLVLLAPSTRTRFNQIRAPGC